MDPTPPGTPVRLLRWLHASVPPEAVARVLQISGGPGEFPLLASALAGGSLVEDKRGWLRVNPLVAVAPEPKMRADARRVVECALEAHPADLGLRVEQLALQDWGHPDAVSQSTTLLRRARLSGRGDEFIRLIEAAGLLHALLRHVPHALLRLLIDEGYTSEARPFVGDTDLLLLAALALAGGDARRVEQLLAHAPEGSGFDARILRARAKMMLFESAAALALLNGLDGSERSPEEAIELALVRHRIASHTIDLGACATARGELERALDQAEDGWLRTLLVEALVQETLRVGDLPQAGRWLDQLRAMVDEGWAPGLSEMVEVHAGKLACLRGQHHALDVALARPVTAPRHQTARSLQRAAALVFRGAPALALRMPTVERFGGFRAQLLSELGKFGEALLDLEHEGFGYLHSTRDALRASVLLMMGEARMLPLPDEHFPLLASKVLLHNGRVHLSRGELEQAAGVLAAAAQSAEDYELGELAAHVQYALADLDARMGHRERALEGLERLLAGHRHATSFLANRAMVARSLLDGRIVDGHFIDRLIRQGDALSLALVSRVRTLPAAAVALVCQLPDGAREFMARTFVEVAEVQRLTVVPGCRWVVLPDGTELDFRRSGPPRLVLQALIRARVNTPEHPLDVDALISAGWPGERILWQAARTRLYTVIRRLRAMGIDGIETVSGGYRIAPRWSVHEVGGPIEE